MKVTDTVLIATYLVAIPVYVWALFYIQGRKKRRGTEALFYQGLLSIIHNEPNAQDQIGQIATLYRHLSERNSQLSNTFRIPIELIEELIVQIDTKNDKNFSTWYKFDRPHSERAALVSCLSTLKANNPFSLVSSKEANLLSTILNALETGNKELGGRMVYQLSEELEGLESKLRIEGRKNSTSFIITVVSAILTVFFGVISLVPLLTPSKPQPNITVERDAPQAGVRPPVERPSP